MSGLIIVLAVFIAFVVVDILAVAYGVDSRPGFADPAAPARGLTY